jgi:release factor glutamine methyltransferase
VSTEALQDVWTVRRVLLWTQQWFAKAGLGSPRLDAEVLLAHCLGTSRVGLYTSFEQPLSESELAQFRALIKRRLAGEPVAYLTGQREFYSLPLHVTPAVLIPRPETELLVEEALRFLGGSQDARAKAGEPVERAAAEAEIAEEEAVEEAVAQTQAVPGVALTVVYDPEPSAADSPADSSTDSSAAPPVVTLAAASSPDSLPAGVSKTVIDIGTGSGAIALAIKHERPSVRVIAIDLSPDALAVARHNATTLGLTIEFREGDLLTALPEDIAPDLVLANLPYIPTAEIAGLSKDVQSEPRLALDGGADGLAIVKRLVAMAAQRLRPGGAILLEIGAGQAGATEQLLRQAGFSGVHSLRDYAGIERLVSGRLAAPANRRSP